MNGEKVRLVKGIALLVMVSTAFIAAPAYESMVGPTGVLKYDAEKSYGGYTLFSPMINCTTTYLIDMEGNIIHQWDTEFGPGAYAMLLPNGNLLRGGTLENPPANFGGAGGIIQEIDWDGNIVWEYKVMTQTEIQHHCFARMPNGNTLILAWEFKSIEEAIEKGRDPNTIPPSVAAENSRVTGFWVDFVREVNQRGETVWEWHVWDHVGKGPLKFLDLTMQRHSKMEIFRFSTTDRNARKGIARPSLKSIPGQTGSSGNTPRKTQRVFSASARVLRNDFRTEMFLSHQHNMDTFLK